MYIPVAGEFVEVVKNSNQCRMDSGTKRLAAAGDIFEVVAIDAKRICCRTRHGECAWGSKFQQGLQIFNLGDVKASELWFRVGHKVQLNKAISHAFKMDGGKIRQAEKDDIFRVIQVSHKGDIILVHSDPHPQFHVSWYGTTMDQTHYLYVSDLKRMAADCVCDNYTLGVAGCQCGWFQKEQEMKQKAEELKRAAQAY